MLYSGIDEKQGGITQKYLSPKNGTLIISFKKVFIGCLTLNFYLYIMCVSGTNVPDRYRR